MQIIININDNTSDNDRSLTEKEDIMFYVNLIYLINDIAKNEAYRNENEAIIECNRHTKWIIELPYDHTGITSCLTDDNTFFCGFAVHILSSGCLSGGDVHIKCPQCRQYIYQEECIDDVFGLDQKIRNIINNGCETCNYKNGDEIKPIEVDCTDIPY